MEEHVEYSNKTFRRWRDEAKKLKLRFQFRVTDFVPANALFVDPHDEQAAYLVLTPVVYEIHGPDRPHFVLRKKHQKVAFDYYWSSYFKRVAHHSRIA